MENRELRNKLLNEIKKLVDEMTDTGLLENLLEPLGEKEIKLSERGDEYKEFIKNANASLEDKDITAAMVVTSKKSLGIGSEADLLACLCCAVEALLKNGVDKELIRDAVELAIQNTKL